MNEMRNKRFYKKSHEFDINKKKVICFLLLLPFRLTFLVDNQTDKRKRFVFMLTDFECKERKKTISLMNELV